MEVIITVLFISLLPIVLAWIVISQDKEANTDRIPTLMRCHLPRTDALQAIEQQLGSLEFANRRWTISERDYVVGRLQAQIAIPIQIRGGSETFGMILNISITDTDGSSSTVDWSYVDMFPPFAQEIAPEMTILEGDICRQTNAMIRAALLDAEDRATVREGEVEETASSRAERETSEQLRIAAKKADQSPIEAIPKEQEATVLHSETRRQKEEKEKAGVLSQLAPLMDGVMAKAAERENEPPTAGSDEKMTAPPPAVSPVSSPVIVETGHYLFGADVASPGTQSTTDPALAINCTSCGKKKDPNFAFCLYCGK
ncbi:MAG TPA: zinc ribbon domain-containing protein [Candidatus Obscuribacterales bacterium]